MSGRTLVIGLALLLPVGVLAAVMLGAVALPATSVLAALAGFGGDEQTALIVLDIRLPRALLTALVGALLAVCGAAMQGFVS